MNKKAIIGLLFLLGMLLGAILPLPAQQTPAKPGAVGIVPLPHTCGPKGDEQCVPGGAPPKASLPEEVIPLKLEDKADILQLQKDVQNSELQAFQISQQLDAANKATQAKGAALDRKLNALRKTYNLPDDAQFDPDKLSFTKAKK